MDGDFLLIELRATPSEWPLIVGDGKTREHEKMKDGARSAPVADLESRRKLSVRRYNWAGRDLKLPNCRCPLGNPSRDRWREIPKSRISVRCEAGETLPGALCAPALLLKRDHVQRRRAAAGVSIFEGLLLTCFGCSRFEGQRGEPEIKKPAAIWARAQFLR